MLSRERMVRTHALAICRDRDTGAILRRVVIVVAPAALFAKSALGQVYRDQDGAYRWITVHPHGDDAPGQPVKIRESKTEPGTWHVVAGAGGKLNYLRLTGVKTPEEYQARARDLRTRQQQHAQEDRARLRALPEPERRAELTRRAAQRETVRSHQRALVAEVAKALDWPAASWQFAPIAEQLRAEGATPEQIARLEHDHEQRLYRRATEVLRQSRRALLAERDAALGEIPLTATEPDQVGLRDVLDPPAKPVGTGTEMRQPSSPSEQVAALARADRERLAEAMRTAEQARDEGEPGAAEDVTALRRELRVATLVERAAAMTPEAIAAERESATRELADLQGRAQARETALLNLRDRPEHEATAEAVRLEREHEADTIRMAELRAHAIDLAVLASRAGTDTARLEHAVRAAAGDAGLMEFRALREALTATQRDYHEAARLQGKTAPPPLPPAAPIQDAEAVLQLLARQKALQRLTREARDPDRDALDARLFGKGYFTETGTPTTAMVAAAERDMEGLVRERATRAFLEQVESPELLLGRGGVFQEDYDRPDLHRALERHVGAGAYNALNTAALAVFKQPVLRREVVDVLGATGGAQLLAHLVRQQESPAVARAFAEQLGGYHVREHVDAAERQVEAAQQALDAADQALASLTTPADVTTALAANEKRRHLIEDARRTMGQALGEYEATAALVQALGEKPPAELHTTLGPIETDTAIRQLRAVGLERQDYALTHDGTNVFATIRPSGFSKLAAAPDPTRLRMTDDVLAIKQGQRDETDWRPKGLRALPDRRFDGRYIHLQRAIKTVLRTKRLALALGTGNGKTAAAIGALTEARQTPATGVRRGLMLVPSSVVGQFGEEFERLVEPGTMRWAAHPGADRATRLAEHAAGDTHAVVHTHQAFRDDMVHLLAQDWGVSDAVATDRFMALPRAEANAALAATWKRHGIAYQMLTVDEGHGLLDRDNKRDSVLSHIVQAAGDLALYYLSNSADPVKNDISELRSLLDKLNPDGRYADAAAWNRRYKVNTTAAAEALQREVAPYVYAAGSMTGNVLRRQRDVVSLHPAQQQQYAAVLRAFDALRAARAKGAVDVAAAQRLAPERFAAAASLADREATARAIQRNPGAFKEQALARIVDGAPAAQNAKLQRLVERLKEHPTREKPVVIFAHRLQAVAEIAAALRAAGHRVETLTGGDSARARDAKRHRFQPDSGTPAVDVMVLSDAGATGLNLQRGQTVIQYDRPATAMVHAQRNGRIDRLGQRHPELDFVDLTTDTPYEARAQERVRQKYALRDILTDPAAGLDETGLGALFNIARREAALRERAVA
jgi:hypothetical protein